MGKKEIFSCTVERVTAGFRIAAKSPELAKRLTAALPTVVNASYYDQLRSGVDPTEQEPDHLQSHKCFSAPTGSPVRGWLQELLYHPELSGNLTPRWDAACSFVMNNREFNLAPFFGPGLAEGYDIIVPVLLADKQLEQVVVAIEQFARAVYSHAQPFRTEVRLTVSDMEGTNEAI